mmetsp:Transcript_293/g.379  ORF Transcript_293/g.379 Transcript_293/m.379 type:complete len:229 (-) Transcript_293:497-1183(-)
MSSASALSTPSLILPPASTSSLASFRPRPVMPRTSLITLILDAPAFFRTTSNSVFSSSAAPPASPPAAMTTAPPAAGSMPYSSFRMVFSSCASSRVRPTMLSASAFRSAIVSALSVYSVCVPTCGRMPDASHSVPTAYAASAFSSMVERMLAMLLAGAPIAPAMLEAGAPSMPAMVAISSSRDGIFDTASTPARSRAFSPIAPPRISNFLFSLAKSSATLAAATGSSE